MLAAGELCRRVRIEQQTDEKDAAGTPLNKWQLLASRWAAVEPVSGREFFLAQERHAEVSTRIRIRYFLEVQPKMRVVYRDTWYDIVAVLHNEKMRDETVLMCNARVQNPVP